MHQYTHKSIHSDYKKEKSLKLSLDDSIGKTKYDFLEYLGIEPCEIIFQEIVPMKKYELDVNIQNKRQEPIRVKVSNPLTKYFSISHHERCDILSPGLTKKVKIIFYTEVMEDYFDEIKIQCQRKYFQNVEKKYILPLKAMKQGQKVNYQKLIDKGMVSINTKIKFTTHFKNLGNNCKVKLTKQNWQTLNFEPDQFHMNANSTETISFSLIPTSWGTFHHRILVEVNSFMLDPIDIVYTVAEFTHYLTTEQGKRINQYDFGFMYYGTKKNANFWLINETMEAAEMKLKMRLGWKVNQTVLQSPQELGRECSSIFIEANTKCVKVKPFSKEKIVLTCKTEVTDDLEKKFQYLAKNQLCIQPDKLLQKHKILDNQFHETLIVEINDRKLFCSLKGVYGLPFINVNPIVFNFGLVEIKQTKMETIYIQNIKNNLSVKVKFPKTAFFSVIPPQITIEPQKTEKFEIYLRPTTLGDFSCMLPLITANKYKVDIPIKYQCILGEKRVSVSNHHALEFEQTNLIQLANQQSRKYHVKKYNSVLKPSVLSKKSNFLNKLQASGSLQDTSSNPITNTIAKALLGTLAKQISGPGNSSNSKKNITSKNRITWKQEQQQNMISTGLRLKMPETKDRLFVTRKIDKYEPYSNNFQIKHKHGIRDVTNLKKTPKNRKQMEQINKELSSKALKEIEVSEKIMNFGKVFVHSEMIKDFQIINHNDFSIQVQLLPVHSFLSKTNNQIQIIPSHTKFKFQVVLLPTECGHFESYITYKINNTHNFQFVVESQIELVTLTLSKSSLKLVYQDENNDMFLSDSFSLTNEGNTDAQFCIEKTLEAFCINPKQGILKSTESIQITLTYNHTPEKQQIPAGEPKHLKQFAKPTTLTINQQLTIKVKNGIDIYLKVHSNVLEPKCYIKESKVNFGCCIVPKMKSKPFVLRNLSRIICLYEIQNSQNENILSFDTVKGKVLPESSKQINVTYKNYHINEINICFKVKIRGGLIINVPVTAESVAPSISILEDQFDFGEVCCGSQGILPINIKNQSETMVDLLLDLANRPMTGMEYLDMSFSLSDKEDRCITEKKNGEAVIHKIKVESKTTLKFYLLYRPKVPGTYQFQLPIYIENFITNESMSKIVRCFAKQPKFFLQPSIIKFKKKIINSKDNNCFHPLIQYITIKNPTQKNLKWKIENPKLENSKKMCFEIENKKGEVKPKSWQCINIAFSPYEAGCYSYDLPVLIYNWDKGEYVEEAEIKVEGEGQYPILLFDRRQLILPVVPLNIQSVGMFKIINEGYQTIDIKHRIQALEELIPEISLFYPEGVKMGINKKQLYVIVKFTARKPISFTVKLQINDGYRAYQLPISGTSDNSLLTTFPYLSDKENLFKLQSTSEAVTVRSIDTRNIIDKLHNYYQQVNESDYHLSCEVIQRWINSFMRDDKVLRFPEDLVQSNEILLRFLTKITNKKELQKSLEYTNQEQFYQSLIRLLKSFGCLLNHIRPYFLLSKNSFYNIFLTDPSLKHMVDTYRKYYTVMHIECWIILFYQIFSNFWYNPNKVKQQQHKSNIYSNNELTVLKWIKQIYQEYNEGSDERKFVDFGKDFKDVLAPIYCMSYYTVSQKSQTLDGVNKRLVTNVDYQTNTRFFYNMMTRINLIPILSEDEYQYAHEKEIFLLIYQLYQSLPQQLPRTAPIVFSCLLGEKTSKHIQIRNPSSKIINYWIRMEGSSDFYPEEKQYIRIEPKSTYKLKVEFRSRISEQQTAFLILFNKQELDGLSGVGCTLVFELKSQITGRKSIKKLSKITCPLYESTSVNIPVQNIFNDRQYANFHIMLNEQTEESEEFLDCFNFSVQIQAVKIRKNALSSFELFYTPMILKEIKCYIIFCDSLVGEFQYQIIGVPEIPKTLQQIKISTPIYVNTKQTLELNLPVYNSLKLKALSVVEQKLQLMKNMNNITNSMFQTNVDFMRQGEKQEQLFDIELIMDPKIKQFMEIPSEIWIFQRKGNGKQDLKNKLKVICNFNFIVRDLVLDFVLINKDKKDVRRFKAHINVLSQPIITNLEMRINARSSLVQDIPIENTSLKDWKVSLVISDVNGNDFSLREKETCLARDLMVKKNAKSTACLIYTPEWISESSCKFSIINVTTNEQVIYMIKGISDEPIAESHLSLNIFTGKSSLHSVPISNPYSDRLTYRVETDLSELDCSPQITLEPNQRTSFNIIISLDMPGVIVGYLKFIDRNQRYFWYSLSIEGEDKVVSRENIKLQAMVGNQIEKVLQFKNIYSRVTKFKISLGCDQLQGQKIFDIKPHSSYLYRLKFKPDKVFERDVEMRVFCADYGAYMYTVKLISFERFRKRLPCLTVQVGRKGYKEIKLQCSSLAQPKGQAILSNSNFYVEFDYETIYQSFILAKVYFQPVAQGKQMSIVKLQWGANQEKIYEIQGIGIAPFTVESREFRSVDKQPILDIIKFKNPYQIEMANSTFTINLESNQMKVFRFVGQEEKWETEVKEILPIPLEFIPPDIGYYEAMMTIQADHYKWKYLLKGYCSHESKQKAFDEKICAKVGEQSIKILRVERTDFLLQQSIYPNKIQIIHTNQKLIKVLRSWLSLKIQKQNIEEETDGQFIIYIRFKPTKPIEQIINLSVFSSLQESVRINKKLKITSSPPEPEDKVAIEVTSIKKHIFTIPLPFAANNPSTKYTSKLQKSEYFESTIENASIKLKFLPNNCTFRHNQYSDLLIVESDYEYHSIQLVIILINGCNFDKNKRKN